MTSEINRGYLDHIRRWSMPSGVGPKTILKRAIQIALIPFAILTAIILIGGLRLVLARGSTAVVGSLHTDAEKFVDDLARQYPLHLYPVVAKALELAYLTTALAPVVGDRTAVLEIAIGEGTLSSRVFGERRRVTGLDLNPHSLVNAARMPHVASAIVGDGLHPPVRAGAFDLVLALNFLHHVTEKRATVGAWERAGSLVMFNENTRFWATGWPGPYLLRRLGLHSVARSYAQRIERRSLQHLATRETLERTIGEAAPIIQKRSFLTEQCFFLCGLFSTLMLSFGPPTPAILKWVYLGPLRPIALPLTTSLARLLLRFDAGGDRAADTFVFFTCRGERRGPIGESPLACPRCGSDLATSAPCVQCGTAFPTLDGMLFLLPAQFAHVYDEYVQRTGTPVPAEHL
jgi:hypothetical protein